MSGSGLYRSNRQQLIGGVMGGIAERFGWNANFLRILFVIVSVMSAAFPGILIYIILWLIIPKQKKIFNPCGYYQHPIRTVQEEKYR